MVDVIVVGCGRPKKGMGWKHAQNLLDGKITNARLRAIVEPFLLRDSEKDTEAWRDFQQWIRSLPSDIQVISDVDKCDLVSGNPGPILALIASRTTDIPRHFDALISRGVKAFYVEKPGATSVESFRRMMSTATEHNARVAIGYAKNVSNFALQGLEDFRKSPSNVTFFHNNSYDDGTLDECFARNNEGMVKNMACHELAMAVMFFGLRSDSLIKFKVNPARTILETRGEFEDFRRVSFAVNTAEHPQYDLAFEIDRCGGDWCGIQVDGAPLRISPSEEEKQILEQKWQEDPDIQRYFLLQDEDYSQMLSAVATAILEDKPFPDRIATLADAGEVLKLSEMFDPMTKDFMRQHGASYNVDSGRRMTVWALPATESRL
eukprot:GEMP01065817.1.p1 GENE.GEMP01065817.1~~GEMP01065817.1.p1  ORF type:complete len:377 (-),score=95.33 GEMP01065817.1:129-1259(-)